ncbi:unnamed protein product [Brassica oleracea]
MSTPLGLNSNVLYPLHEVLDLLVNALTHNNADVRTAACICFRNAHVMLPLVQLLQDPSSSVQVPL